MKHSISNKQAALLAACGVFLFASMLAGVLPPYYLTLLVTVGITALASSGLAFLLSSGQVSLGHAAYMGIGAYGSAILARDHGFPAPVALFAGVAAAAFAALVVGSVTRGLKGHFLPLATLAVGIATPTALIGASSVTGGASGFGQIPVLTIGPLDLSSERSLAVLVWLLVAIVVGGLARFQSSRMGRAVAALNASEQMAQVVGIDTPRLKLSIFVIAGALAGLAGGLYAFYFKFISPSPFSLPASINLLIACILGGAASPFGAVLGAVAVMGIEIFLQDFLARRLGLPGHVEMVVFGAVLVGVLLKWPGGIWSALTRFWPSFTALKPTAGTDAESTPSAAERHKPHLLQLSGIGKSFGGLQALANVSFSVGAREIVGLIGPNGAGKSTTFDIATGLTAPTVGQVHLDGHALPAKLSELVELGVARTFQHVKLVPGLSVIENVALGAYKQGTSGMLAGMTGLDRDEEAATFALAWRALDIVELATLASVPAGLLTMGQARLVEVARAIVSRPRLLLLDEPAAGLRTGEKLKLVGLLHRLRRSGTAVLIVEHDMDLVMNCVDRLIVLNRGRDLARGTPDEVRADPQVIAAYLGT
jgi:branched-chain amino acid transport system permease protein